MENVKAFLISSYLLIVCLTSQAQYSGGAYEQRKQDMIKANDQLNAVYQNNLPNGFGSSNARVIGPGSAKAPVYAPTAYEKRRDSLRKVEAQAYNAKIAADYADAVYNNLKIKEKYCYDLFTQCIQNGSILEDLDLKEYCQFIYSDNYGGTKILPALTPSIDRLRAYLKEANTASFDTCFNRLMDAAFFPTTCVQELNKLKKRFPDKEDKIDGLELYTMQFMFGAIMPNYVKENNNINYPLCQYELSSQADRVDILNRFLELYYKYPDYTLNNVANKARKKFNPFYLITEHWYAGSTSDELDLNMKIQLLYTKADSIIPIYKSKKENKKREAQIVYDRLHELAMYFRDKYPFYLYSITAKQWVQMASAQRVDLEVLGGAFFRKGFEKQPLERFVHYQNALKGNLEPSTVNGFQKIEIDYDTYEGNVVNGIPSGQGRWNGAGDYTGSYFEGEFKFGLPTKKGVYKSGGTEIIPGYGFNFTSKDPKIKFIKKW